MSDTLIILYLDRCRLPDLLELQYLAYQSEAAIYQNTAIQPMRQTLTELEAEFDQGALFLAGYQGGRMVASVRGWLEGDTASLNKLIVHPDFQRRRYGRYMMAAIEDELAAAQRYELFTGHKSERNIRFYEDAGYRIFKIQKIHEDLSLVYFEKPALQNQLMGRPGKYLHH
ncbi:GNAT family N-acetyltransferase [Niabella terrae]